MASSREERTNLFFGVCPRLGDKGRFDLAWQIRTVRCLWADIDDCTVDDAIARWQQKEIPEPTAIVHSGHGVHLYWLLNEPFVISDAGDPPPVETEWSLLANGRKKPRRFIFDGQDRIYLDQRRHLSKISPQAQRIQDILAGIADALGGDHTTDLTRLLRLPGTLNRKDERNGEKPTLATLVCCEPSRRYDIDVLGRFAKASKESERQSKVAAMPLPTPRKLSATRADKLADLIAACAIAPPGARSETDFAVCCYAIREGIAADEVWSRAQSVSKFAERGRSYFDITWENATYDVQAGKFETIQRSTAALVKHQAIDNFADSHSAPQAGPVESSERPVIFVNPKSTPVAETMGEITDHLRRAGNCFNRIDQLVVVRDQTISPILSPHELAGLLNQHAEFQVVAKEGAEYRPLPSAYGNTWLNNVAQRKRFPALTLFTHNPVYTDDWRLVEPGFDRESGIYYAGPVIVPREGTEHLDTLLRDFCFKCPADRTNYIGLLLTCLLVSRFIGSKPAALFNGNQPEIVTFQLESVQGGRSAACLHSSTSIVFADSNPRASVAITFDLEMSRQYPQREQTEWDYQKGNLNAETKTYSLEAARIANEYGVKIHFFCVGRVLEQQDIGWLKEIVRLGHPVGNHTYDHVNLWASSPEQTQFRFQRSPWLIRDKTVPEILRENIRLTSLAMKQRLEISPKGFRTPGGSSQALDNREDLQQLLLNEGFTWVSSKYPRHQNNSLGERPTQKVFQSIVDAQAEAQPYYYPTGLLEIPMSPISDVGAFRTGRWTLKEFLHSITLCLETSRDRGTVFDLLCHPSIMYVEDPEFQTIKHVCEFVKQHNRRMQIVDLDEIAQSTPSLSTQKQ